MKQLAAIALARFLFELDGAPVGTVVLALDQDRYTYSSTHAYRRTKAERSDAFTVGQGPVPEGLWLWHRPKAGCVDGVAELSRETGRLCAVDVSEREVKGTTLGRAFTAQYSESGELQSLAIGKSRFVRTSRDLVPGQPYSAGFPLKGKGRRLALEPAVEGARWLEQAPRGTLTKPLAEADSCLEVAQAYVKGKASGRLALGLVVDGGRAYPHAWVVTGAGDVDPSAKEGAGSGAYLELPREQVGALYVELLEGKRALVWR